MSTPSELDTASKCYCGLSRERLRRIWLYLLNLWASGETPTPLSAPTVEEVLWDMLSLNLIEFTVKVQVAASCTNVRVLYSKDGGPWTLLQERATAPGEVPLVSVVAEVESEAGPSFEFKAQQCDGAGGWSVESLAYGPIST